MTLRKIIRIEEWKDFEASKELVKKYGNTKWYLITDMKTKSSGLMPEEQLNQLYERMEGFTYQGKELYVERRAR